MTAAEDLEGSNKWEQGCGGGTPRSLAKGLFSPNASGRGWMPGDPVEKHKDIANKGHLATRLPEHPQHQQDQQQPPATRLPVWPAAPAPASFLEQTGTSSPTLSSSAGRASTVYTEHDGGWGLASLKAASQRFVDVLHAAGDDGSGAADESVEGKKPNGAGAGNASVQGSGGGHVPPLRLSSRAQGPGSGGKRRGQEREEVGTRGQTETQDTEDDEDSKKQRDLMRLKRALLGSRMDGVMPMSDAQTATWTTQSLLQLSSRRGGEAQVDQGTCNLKGAPGKASPAAPESSEEEESILHPGFTSMLGLQELARTLTPRNSRECWNRICMPSEDDRQHQAGCRWVYFAEIPWLSAQAMSGALVLWILVFLRPRTHLPLLCVSADSPPLPLRT